MGSAVSPLTPSEDSSARFAFAHRRQCFSTDAGSKAAAGAAAGTAPAEALDRSSTRKAIDGPATRVPRRGWRPHCKRRATSKFRIIVASATGALVGPGLLVSRMLRQKHIVEGEISSLRHIGRSRRTARCR
jgi:hypothetical protein